MRLLSIAIVASCLAQSVVAEVPNKYLSVGLLSVVCQNEAKKADQDFYVFSKEGDSWISVVGNVTSIHETAEGFTLQLSNSPHETSFLKRTNEGFNLVSFKKGEISKKVCTDLTLLSAEIKSAMLSVANEAYAGELQSASNKIESLRADVLALQEQNAYQIDVLAGLSARNKTDRITASNTIESLRADLLVRQSQNASQKENLAALNERYDEDRKIASDTIENLKVENYEQGQTISRSIEAIRLLEISLSNSQDALEKISEFQSQPNGEAVGELSLNIDLYSQALTNALQNVSELGPEFKKLELVFGQEAQLLELQSKTADQQVALSDLTARYDGLSATSTATIENLQDEARHLQSKINALEARLGSYKTLSKEKAISAQARREMAVLNQQVAVLHSQLQNLQGLLDVAMAKDIAEDMQLQQLGSKLNSALARVAKEERKRRKLEEAERRRLEREALALLAKANTATDKALDLERYRSEFFGRLRDLLGQQKGVRIVGDRFVFGSEVLFSSGNASLSNAGRAEVAKVAETLKAVADRIPEQINWVLRVDGHTDDAPVVADAQFKDNWELSTLRALSVVRYLANELNIPPKRLAANGFGSHQPLNLDKTSAARAQNRRIELKLTEK
jgi:chemotaxis protein MotB